MVVGLHLRYDKDMILAADHVIDVGPYAGIHGGHIVAQGTPAELLGFNTLTTQYINGLKKIELPTERRKGNGKELKLIGAKGHNLNNVSVTFPLGTFTVNIIGWFAIGLVFGFSNRGNMNAEWIWFLAPGVCGGFTTFSAYALHAVRLFDAGRYAPAFMSFFLSPLFGGIAVIAGMTVARLR